MNVNIALLHIGELTMLRSTNWAKYCIVCRMSTHMYYVFTCRSDVIHCLSGRSGSGRRSPGRFRLPSSGSGFRVPTGLWRCRRSEPASSDADARSWTRCAVGVASDVWPCPCAVDVAWPWAAWWLVRAEVRGDACGRMMLDGCAHDGVGCGAQSHEFFAYLIQERGACRAQ